MNTLILLVLFSLVLTEQILAQSKNFSPIPFLHRESQSNIVVVVNSLTSNPKLPPEIHTNVISNTNLFSRTEERLLSELRLKYQHVTTNTGPVGTILKSATNYVKAFVSIFEHTNTHAIEEITFSKMTTAKYRTTNGDGYDVDFTPNYSDMLNFRQFKQGQRDGLYLSFYEDHCASYMRFSNGKAIGKWLLWGTGNTLLLEAYFTEPYDFVKHSQLR